MTDNEIKNPSDIGEVDLDTIEYTEPKSKWGYDWTGIKKAIEAGKGFVLPVSAKKNSIDTGLAREKINGRVASLENGQLIVIPKESA